MPNDMPKRAGWQRTPLDSIRQQKTRKALCYAGFLDFVGHCWTGIWWSWGRLNLDFNYMNLMSLYSLLMSVVVQVVVLSEKVPPP